MSEHRWGEPDDGGVRECLRGGCTVRCDTTVSFWQRTRNAHWMWTKAKPLPSCSGTDAPEAALPEHALDALPGRLGAKAAPSPLEVVRECVAWLENSGRGSDKTYAARLSNALATLEASIRAEEREACAKVATLACETESRGGPVGGRCADHDCAHNIAALIRRRALSNGAR